MSARRPNVRVKKMSVKRSKKPTIVQRLSKTTLGDIGELVTAAGGMARRMLNVETKRFDASSARGAMSPAGGIAALSLMAAGDDDNQRSGRSIRTTALELRAQFDLDTAIKTQDFIRFMVFVDMENNGAVPATTDVLASASPLSPFNRNNLQRFIPISDELFSLDTATGTQRSLVIKTALDTHIRYRAATANAADLGEGNLFLLWLCGSAVANTSYAAYQSRLSFVDN